jgi:hypothetical protein
MTINDHLKSGVSVAFKITLTIQIISEIVERILIIISLIVTIILAYVIFASKKITYITKPITKETIGGSR